MFALVLILGLSAYSIFLLGILGLLYPLPIIFITVITFIIFILFIKKRFTLPRLDKYSKMLLIFLLFQILVNIIGVLGPEIGFDALWYHLTLPKLWLQYHSLIYFPGAVYKYSVMPMLTEMFYIPAIFIQGANLAKFIHFVFGILSCLVTYKISRICLSRSWALLAVLIFYSNLVVGWESTTAYIDLSRTFFESAALLFFLRGRYHQSAVSLGFAVCTKLLALVSLPIFIILLFLQKKFSRIVSYTLIVITVPALWFIRSFIATGNPVYPFFNSIYGETSVSLNPADIWNLFTHSPDPVSPLFLILFPLAFFIYRNFRSRGLLLFSALSLPFWFITPRSGGGRFILPYLPAFSALSVIIISFVSDIFIKKSLIFLALFLALTSVLYRSTANFKYLPVILGRQSSNDFLSRHLDFTFGDYIDSDNYLKNNLPPDSKISVLGINNKYYLNYFITDSLPDYILIRYTDADLPQKYSKALLIHENLLTKTRLYKL
jgi:hypothetical protein